MNELSSSITSFVAEILLQVPLIGKHSIQTAAMAHMIADRLFDDEDSVFFTSMGGVLHDIGFILPRYSRSLFEYKSARDLLELDSAQKSKYLIHTTIGGYILSNFLGMYEYSDIAFYHHTPAYELDPTSFTHIISNIVNISDFITTHFEKIEISLAKVIIPELLEKVRRDYFDDIYLIAQDLLKKDITWWNLEDSKFFFENNILPRMRTKAEDGMSTDGLIELGHFTAYLVDAKSPFTRKHSERIAILAKDLGCEYGFEPGVCTELYIAGLFHDIGKIAIPLGILEKPSSLDTGEFWLMRKHVYYTGILLRHFESQGHRWPVWARQHHERLDGKGYPCGLKADEIPLESRILQICDVFIAFTEDRPYREPLDFEEALEIIEREVNRGKLDGEVFEKLKVLVKNGYEFPQKTITEEIIETVEFLLENLG